MDTYTYRIGENLYLNLTNRCTNACAFCVRNGKEEYEGHKLWLKGGEPTAEQIVSEIGDPRTYRQIVFCGFGEPTFRLETMLSVCKYVHERGGIVRLNTNGHGSAIAGKDIAPLLKGNVDQVNISLNAPTEAEYNRVCFPKIPNAFGAMLEFARSCKREEIDCWFSVVDCIGQEAVEKCRAVAAEVGIPLRVREMIR